MSWALLQSGSNTVSSGNGTFTFGSSLTSGSKIICWVVVSESGTTEPVTSVKDGAGNSWTQLASVPPGGGTNTWVECWMLDTPAGDAGTKPTLTATVTSDFGVTMVVEEFSGLLAGNTSAVLDGSPATSKGTSSPATTGALSTSAANELLMGCYGDPGDGVTVTNAPGYTADAHNVNASGLATCFVSYKNSTDGAESASWTLSGPASDGWETILLAFKLAGGGTTTTGATLSAGASFGVSPSVSVSVTLSAAASLADPGEVVSPAVTLAAVTSLSSPAATGSLVSLAALAQLGSPGQLAAGVSMTAQAQLLAQGTERQAALNLGTSAAMTFSTLLDAAVSWQAAASLQDLVAVTSVLLAATASLVVAAHAITQQSIPYSLGGSATPAGRIGGSATYQRYGGSATPAGRLGGSASRA